MNFTAFEAVGWRERARRSSSGSKAHIRRIVFCILAAGLTGALVIASVENLTASAALLKSYEAIHSLFGAGLMSASLYAGLSVFAGIANALLAAGEALSGLALGGAMMGALPFAQPSGSSAATPASGGPATSIARPEMQIGLYGGKSESPNSDVFLKAPDGTDLVLKDLKWKEESFKPSPYYGGRGVDWSARMPALGLMVDFTHAKATAIRSQTVTLSGTHKGEAAPGTAPFESIFGKLEFTHGLNFLTLNGMYRAAGLHRRIVPYAGVGLGFMMPHVDAWRAGRKKEDVHEPQLTGIAAQALGGIEWRVFRSDRRSLFTEYKMTYTTNDVTMKDGGNVLANIWVHQFNLGFYYTPWRAGDAAAR